MVEGYVSKGYGAKPAVEVSLTLYTMQCDDGLYVKSKMDLRKE